MENIPTADLVREELEKDIFLKNSLSKKLINNSALARKLFPVIKAKNSKATIESITISISRYASFLKLEKPEKELIKQIAYSQLSMKNDVVHATFPRNEKIVSAINEISKKIRWDADELLLINQGSGEITLILDKKNIALVKGISKDAIIRAQAAIISIGEAKIPGPTSIEVPGLYSYFLTQLASHGINILEVVSTPSQLTLVVIEKDLIKSYEVLDGCIKHYRTIEK